MRLRRLAGIAIRLAVVAALLAAAWHYRGGIGDVSNALQSAGWQALAAISAWHFLSLGLCGVAQRGLMPRGSIGVFLLGRWVHEAVGELAGFLPLSGEVAAARTLSRRGIAAPQAAALTIVDLTAEGLAQFVFTALGVFLWLGRHPAGEVGHWALIGLVASAPLLAVFLFIQRSGLVRFVETLPARLMPSHFKAPDEAAGTLAAIQTIYANRMRMAACAALHLIAWLIGTGETAIAVALLGRPLSILDIVAMEAFVTALRGVAFFVPAALGVQEGAYVVIGAALGLPPDIALAVSLLKRGREIIFGVPGLIAWQMIEARGKPRANG